MRRYMMTMMVAIFAWTGMNAMDYETARERAYYLTDKMAYELNLNDRQYNDAYEINLDYLLSLNTADDLAEARYLAYRNDDLRHILYDWQWTAFAAVDYLFRPVWWLSGGWYFPVYRHYAHDYYFYHRPSIFWDYRGGHGRFYYAHGFYHDRRPAWHGGLRGMHHHNIGHPNGSNGGRYGHPGNGSRGSERRGGGYHFDHNNGRQPGGHDSNKGSLNGGASGGIGNNRGDHNGIGNNRGNHNGSTHGIGSPRGSMGSTRGSVNQGGGSRSNSSRSGGGSRGGSSRGGSRR